MGGRLAKSSRLIALAVALQAAVSLVPGWTSTAWAKVSFGIYDSEQLDCDVRADECLALHEPEQVTAESIDCDPRLEGCLERHVVRLDQGGLAFVDNDGSGLLLVVVFLRSDGRRATLVVSASDQPDQDPLAQYSEHEGGQLAYSASRALGVVQFFGPPCPCTDGRLELLLLAEGDDPTDESLPDDTRLMRFSMGSFDCGSPSCWQPQRLIPSDPLQVERFPCPQPTTTTPPPVVQPTKPLPPPTRPAPVPREPTTRPGNVDVVFDPGPLFVPWTYERPDRDDDYDTYDPSPAYEDIGGCGGEPDDYDYADGCEGDYGDYGDDSIGSDGCEADSYDSGSDGCEGDSTSDSVDCEGDSWATVGPGRRGRRRHPRGYTMLAALVGLAAAHLRQRTRRRRR